MTRNHPFLPFSRPLSTDRPISEWTIAAALAFAGVFNPLPIPLAGLHKFYLGQPFWGSLYLLLGWTQIPRIAAALEGGWYVMQCRKGNTPQGDMSPSAVPDGIAVGQQTQAIATALRELEDLRQEGLISEQEFEQSRRALLATIS